MSDQWITVARARQPIVEIWRCDLEAHGIPNRVVAVEYGRGGGLAVQVPKELIKKAEACIFQAPGRSTVERHPTEEEYSPEERIRSLGVDIQIAAFGTLTIPIALYLAWYYVRAVRHYGYWPRGTWLTGIAIVYSIVIPLVITIIYFHSHWYLLVR
jgi:hypothetical protein